MCKNTVNNNNNNNNRDIKISLQGPRQAGERRYKCDRKWQKEANIRNCSFDMTNVRRHVESYNDEPDSKITIKTLLIMCLPAGSLSIDKAVFPLKERFFNSSLFIVRNREIMWTVSGSRSSRRENIQAGWVAAQGILLAARSDLVSVGGPNLWNRAAMCSLHSSFLH
jgi:hypothetical protein